ncbi:DUF262 domain-containing protein [Campylobacter concisus]|jgi:Uncharacterized conserved protein|uniref:DUF262 domain-containing protein n=1 Tax=Campylobacter concisus TaxID=199 RepID=UPI000CD8D24D|nr:DUF262 domain-containing protein [Campylobacter concisus]
MEAKTTIRRMLSGNFIRVPNYQRAYSWDKDKQVKQFLIDLDDYIDSGSTTPYYFGHFLFEKKSEDLYNIIDGQQRLTTIEIFLSSVFKRLASIRPLTEDEKETKEDVIKRNSKYRFSTVEYDNPFFKDYVIDQKDISRESLETLSAVRIMEAFDYFEDELKLKDEISCIKYIECITNSACTTHIVNEGAEAIQMFIFQNNRGKDPTKLEIVKAQFMYEIWISNINQEEKSEKIKELQERFEHIYKSISVIENNLSEDDVLLYALRVSFNTLNIDVSMEKIEKELKNKDTYINFIMKFTLELENSFESLKPFFTEKKIYEIYSLATLGKTQMMPFVIKSYKYKISDEDKARLFAELESLVIRHRIIGTRAHLEDRINEVYKEFTEKNKDISQIIDHIRWIKKEADENNWWWYYYWSDARFKEALQGALDHKIAKHILWKYENYLISQEKQGYGFMQMEQIVSPELEHIAPQTPSEGIPIAKGYCEYDEEFKNMYLDCIGNYLLISKSHNCSIGNVSFADKISSYNVLAQQREIKEIAKDKWDKDAIKKRHDKIVKFVIEKI